MGFFHVFFVDWLLNSRWCYCMLLPEKSGMSWGVKTTCFKVAGVSLGGSGVSIGGVRILRVVNHQSRPMPP